jgi:hypothetical protein
LISRNPGIDPVIIDLIRGSVTVGEWARVVKGSAAPSAILSLTNAKRDPRCQMKSARSASTSMITTRSPPRLPASPERGGRAAPPAWHSVRV